MAIQLTGRELLTEKRRPTGAGMVLHVSLAKPSTAAFVPVALQLFPHVCQQASSFCAALREGAAKAQPVDVWQQAKIYTSRVLFVLLYGRWVRCGSDGNVQSPDVAATGSGVKTSMWCASDNL